MPDFTTFLWHADYSELEDMQSRTSNENITRHERGGRGPHGGSCRPVWLLVVFGRVAGRSSGGAALLRGGGGGGGGGEVLVPGETRQRQLYSRSTAGAIHGSRPPRGLPPQHNTLHTQTITV